MWTPTLGRWGFYNFKYRSYFIKNRNQYTELLVGINDFGSLYSSLSSIDGKSKLKKSDFIYNSEILLEKNSFLPETGACLTDVSFMFAGCKSLISLPDLSDLNTSKITNMRFMFAGCNSLISLPDISNWDISNVTNLEWMFCYCNSLASFPDISNWNTSKVKYMSLLFAGCSCLLELPCIFKLEFI